MHLGLEKRAVLITGGTKGIGLATVKAFLAEGATVHFCSRTESDIKAVSAQLAADYPEAKAHGSTVDVADAEALKSWITAAADQHEGRIDVLIANVSALAAVDSAESWRRMFEVDLLGLYTMVATAQPFLEASASALAASGGSGTFTPNVVAVSSVSGRDIDFTAPSPYGPVKAAVIHYTASLARQLAPKGIRANTVSPGNIYFKGGVWDQIESGAPELFKEQMAKNPMGRMGRAEEVADVVVFVSSARARFVSGSNATVDGALCNGVQF